MKDLRILFVVLLLSVPRLFAADPKFSVTGLAVRIGANGTECDFLLDVDSGYIPDFELSDSGITRLADNQGTDLGTKPVTEAPDYEKGPCFYSVSTFDPDRKLTVTVLSPRKCHAGATQLSMEGELRFKYCATKDKGEVKNVILKNGTEFMFGKQQAVIADVKRTDKDMEFTVKLPGVPESFEVDEIELADRAGQEVDSSMNRTRYKIQDQPAIYDLIFHQIKPARDEVTFQYELWPDLQETHLPFKITIPMAGGKATPVEPVPESKVKPAVQPPASPAALPPAVVQPVPPTPVQPAATGWPRIKVSGVMKKGSENTAIINGEMVSAGGVVNGVTVTDISGNTVTVKYQDKTATLKTGGSLP